MKKIFVLWLALQAAALVACASDLKVGTASITTGIVDRSPIDAVEVFNTSISPLYCFSRIEGAQEDTHVTHVWRMNGKEMSRSNLAVRSSYWRTWSAKTIDADSVGNWQVEIRDAEDQLLKTLEFTLN